MLPWNECNVAVGRGLRLTQSLGVVFLLFLAFFCLATVILSPGGRDAGNADRL